MIQTAQGIIDAAVKLSSSGGKRRVAVAVAQDADVIGAVRSAYDDGICNASLFGDAAKIKELAEIQNVSLDGIEIHNIVEPGKAVQGAVALAAEGNADVVMKGFVSTSALLRGVLSKELGLRMSPTLSHVAVLDVPGRRKLLMMTDGGMVVSPDFNQRFDIAVNALIVARALGISPIRLAFSAAVDRVSGTMPQSHQSLELMQKMKDLGHDDIIVSGPTAFDTAAADGKDGADIFVVGSIEECNVTAKTLIVFANAIFSGVILGARIPVSLVSRTDPVLGKKSSIALACLVSEYYRQFSGKGGR